MIILTIMMMMNNENTYTKIMINVSEGKKNVDYILIFLRTIS